MTDFLNKTLWNYEFPWGNSLKPYFCIAKEYNVHWLGGMIVFDNHREFISGWIMDENWQKKSITAGYSYGIIVSKEQYGYGTYVLLCQLPNFRGSWPAFWFYDTLPPEQGGIQVEIDVMEHFRKDAFLTRFKTSCTYHDGDTRSISKARWQWCPVDSRIMEFKFEWQPDYMTWYVNDKQTMHVKKTDVVKFPDKPLNIILGSGLGDWRVQDDRLSPFYVHEFHKL